MAERICKGCVVKIEHPMHLPQSLFETILGSPNLRLETRPSDRRQDCRVRLGSVAVLVHSRERCGPEQVPVRLRDLSRSGLGFFCARPFAADERFAVKLATRSGQTIWIWSAAARCESVGSGGYVVGAAFDRLLHQSAPADPESAAVHDSRNELPLEVEEALCEAYLKAVDAPADFDRARQLTIARIRQAILG